MIECYTCSKENRIAGQAFTNFACKNCGQIYIHPTTAVPTYCKDCATALRICQRCSRDIDRALNEDYQTNVWSKANRTIEVTTAQIDQLSSIKESLLNIEKQIFSSIDIENIKKVAGVLIELTKDYINHMEREMKNIRTDAEGIIKNGPFKK